MKSAKRKLKKAIKIIKTIGDYILDTDLNELAASQGDKFRKLVITISIVSIAFSVNGINQTIKNINIDIIEENGFLIK